MAVFSAQPESGSPAAVQALAAAIEARDNYTHDHSEQVVSLATDVAELLGLSPSERDTVRHGALLHDVGKLAIPNEILHKPGPLNDAEWRVMAEHPVIGERILRRTPQLGTWRRSCATSTSAGTATGTPTAWPARRSRSPRGAPRQVRHPVRPAGRRGAAQAPAGARAQPFFFGGVGVVIIVAL